ncbi:hypothetical protein QF042_000312 [Pedobacter sp. W3I1]|nr:hypothetical protein [Pedobacter sp. W3I1]
MMQIGTFFCNLQLYLVERTVPPKPDQSGMPIFSIGRSGSGTGAGLSTTKPAFQKIDFYRKATAVFHFDVYCMMCIINIPTYSNLMLKSRLYHNDNFSVDFVMLNLSKHIQVYLTKSFDKLRMTIYIYDTCSTAQ